MPLNITSLLPYLKYLPNNIIKKYNILIITIILTIITLSLAYEPQTKKSQISLWVLAGAVFLIGVIFQIFIYFKNRYTDIVNTFSSSGSLSIDFHDEKNKIFNILKSNLKKNLFQYLSKYNGDDKVIEIYSKKEIEIDKQKVFENYKIEGVNTKKIDYVFKEITVNNKNINDDFEKKKIHTEGRTLRLIFDIKKGGAYIIGDCSIDSWSDENGERYDMRDNHILIFGYTTKQKNVNKCAEVIGYIIDEIRATHIYGDDNSSPIINIK